MIMASIAGVFLAGICSAQIQPLGTGDSYENESYAAFLGTVSIPVGDFAKEEGSESGNAKLGAGLGLVKSIPMSRKASFLLEGRLMYNPFDISPLEEAAPSEWDIESSGYITVWALGGIQINNFTSTGNRFYLKGLAGFCYGVSPGVEVSYMGETADLLKSASAGAFAYGAGAGLVIRDRFLLDASFMTSTPEYNLESEFDDESAKVKIDHSIFAISAGFLF